MGLMHAFDCDHNPCTCSWASDAEPTADDIVQRLRDHAECPYCVTAYHDDLSFEAADEIERLRSAIDTALMHMLRGEGVQAINTLLTTNLATTRKAEQ